VKHLAVAFLAVALLSGCGSGDGGGSSGEMTVDLAEQKSSGESGTATLTAAGDKTTVVISLDNAPADPQPAHIHKGSCKELDPTPAYALANVADGKSTTDVDVPLQELEDADYAINVHKSTAEVETYVACGDIGSGGGGTGTGSDGYGY
jgi:hypothetical protein